MGKTVLHVFGWMNRGGAELRTMSLIRPLAQAGIKLEFLSLSGRPGSLDNELRSIGSEVHYHPLGVLFPLRFWRFLKTSKFDVVHSHVSLVSGVILFIALLAGVEQRICHFRSTNDSLTESRIRQFRNQVLRLLLRLVATDIVAVAEGVMITQWGADWVKDDRCIVLYNGLETSGMPPRRGKQYWEEFIEDYDNSDVFIHVARMHASKNQVRVVQIFLSYFIRHRCGYLVLVGKEVESIKRVVQGIVRKNGIDDRVIFLGERTDAVELLNQASCLIFPSLWEGMPGAVLEASMLGTPIVASDIPGIHEVAVQSGGVLLVSLESGDEVWRSGIEESLANNNHIARSAQQRRFLDSEFTIERCTKKVLDLYGRRPKTS